MRPHSSPSATACRWLFLLAVACAADPAGNPSPQPTTLGRIAGDGQTAPVGTTLPVRPRVRVTDATGQGVAGVDVRFTPAQGAGSTGQGVVPTDASGHAETTWTLGGTTGPQQLSVTADGLTGSPQVFVATATVGPAARIIAHAWVNPTGTVGMPPAQTPAVKVVDAHGNGIGGIAVGFAIIAGNGSLSGDATITGPDGVARPGSWVLGTTAGLNILRAAITTLPTTTVDLSVTAQAGIPATIEAITQLQQTLLVGDLVPEAPRVRIKDQYGNPIAGASAIVTVTAGNGSVSANATTDVAGEATVSGWRAGSEPGLNRVTAGFGALPPVSFEARGVAFLQVAVGSASVCGLVHGGHAYCWGSNSAGSVGNGDPARVDRPLPTVVAGGKIFSQLVGANGHFCALTLDGRAWCWGDNSRSQIGDGAPPFGANDRLVPTAVSGSHQFVSLVAGGLHTCGLKSDGSTWCWGGNESGQLGNGEPADAAPTPVQVIGGQHFVELAGGHAHTCGLTTQGSAYCWGSVEPVQGSRLTPTPVDGGHIFTTLASGGGHNCATKANGAAWCWGANHDGQLGDGSQETWHFLPIPVAGGHAFTVIDPSTGGPSHTCGIRNDATLWCWGGNPFGALGHGSLAASPLPTAVLSSLRFTHLATGFATTCAVAETTALYCWGLNAWGQVGDGSLIDRPVPTLVRFRTP